jgi:hypothetical protein
VFDEQLRLLKQEAMCGIRVEDELRVRQMLPEVERVVDVSDFSSSIIIGIVRSLRQAQRSPATVPPARDRNAMLVD